MNKNACVEHTNAPFQEQEKEPEKEQEQYLIGSLMTPLTVTRTFLGPARSRCSHSQTPWGRELLGTLARRNILDVETTRISLENEGNVHLE